MLSTLKFIFASTTIFILIFSAVLITVLNMYKPTFKVSLNDKFIGYFGDYEQFEDVYNTLVNEQIQIDPEVKVYLNSEPVFNNCYIRDSLIAKQNVYTSLREELKEEFTIYNVAIENGKKMTFNSRQEADKYVNDFKAEIPKVKSEVTVEKVESLGEMTSIDVANNIYKDIVSRNKPVVRVAKKYTPAKVSNNKVPQNVAVVASAQGGIWPTSLTRISSPFGWRGSSMHTGIDICGAAGSPIYAYKSGLVVFAGWNGAYGYMLKVDHGGGIATWYAHSSQLLVTAGDTVSQGQTIAKVGTTGWSTGNHLHFEMRINGAAVNPYPYIK